MVYDNMFKNNRLLDCLGRLIVVNVCITRTRKPTLTDNYWEIRSKLQRAAVIGEFPAVQLVLLGHYRSAALISATWNNIKHVNSVNSIPRIFTPQKPEHPCLSRFLYVLAVGPLPPAVPAKSLCFLLPTRPKWPQRVETADHTKSKAPRAIERWRRPRGTWSWSFWDFSMRFSWKFHWNCGEKRELNKNIMGIQLGNMDVIGNTWN